VGDEILCLDGVDADEEWWEGKNLRTGLEGVFPVLFTKGWQAVAAGWAKDMPSLVRSASSLSKKSALAQKRSSMSPNRSAVLSPTQSEMITSSPLIPTIEEASNEASAKGNLTSFS
jgi:hypothetical protein